MSKVYYPGSRAALTALFVAGSALVSAQVVPTPQAPSQPAGVALTSPGAAPPLLQTVSITGTGFPAGAISNLNNVTITIAPPAGNGSPVSVTPTAITPNVGATRTLQFKIPASLTAAQPIVNAQVTISDSTAPNNFTTASGDYWLLTIQPPASVLSVSPGAATRGSTATLNIVGYYTHFTRALPAVQLTGPSGPALTPVAGSVVVTDDTHLSAQFAIPPGATAGTYLVQTKVGTEIASLQNGFLVSVNPGLTLSSILPGSGAAGSCPLVSIIGNGTSWQNGVTIASMGDGVDINGVSTGPINVTDATHASFTACIDPLARPGGRTLTVVTGGEYEMASNAFTITSNGATLQSVSPNTGLQGTNATLTFTGVGTHWLQGATTVSLGGGINIGNIIVNSPTSMTVNISISPSASITSYTATATTNGEFVSLGNAFSVTLATPFLSAVSPAAGTQGQTLNVNFTGTLTSFLTGSLTANFGGDITVNSVNVVSNTSASANITISSTAFTGGRTASITTDGSIYSFTFTVLSAGASITSVTPASGLQGASVALTVTGAGTHWAQGLTFASMGSYIVINRVQVNGATNAEVDITIPSSAPTGRYSLTMSTNGEIETDSNAFNVLPYTPSLTISPSIGMIGTTVNVNLSGNLTHFANAMSASPTVLNIDGQGVTIQNFQVTSPTSATAQFVIAATAPTAPAVPCANQYGGNRLVTMTTPEGVASEIVNTGFCVTSTPAALISISPFQSTEPKTLTVTITGQYTHFQQGVTTVGFGPEISTNSVTVLSMTQLTANITIPSTAPIGWLPVFVNTNAEQLTIGFNIVAPATAALTSVTPNSGIQGQSMTVNIVGLRTNFDITTTQAILGAGITVNQLTINSPASATAQISIDPTAYVGGRTVTMISGLNDAEVVSGPLFSVQQGVSTITEVGCGANANTAVANLAASACNVSNNGIPQGTITTFAVQGESTHWLQGETTLDFGSGITTSQLNIIDATHATAQITVSYSAALGFRTVTATTNGEVAPSFSDAINIVASEGLGLNITPNFSAQGTTFTLQVNGTDTHFTANNTTATFGNNNGVNVTNVNVISPTQMNLSMQILGTAGIGPYTLTVTTTGLPVPPNPQSTEQLILPNSFSVTPGAAIITNVTPTTGAQGTTAQLQVTGQNTSFLTGVTTAFLSSGGCNPPAAAGVNVSNVTASSTTSATVSIAIAPNAPTGFQTLCMYTGGESVSYANAFKVTPGTPTLNSVTTPTNGNTGQQGQIISAVTLTGQFTHWTQGTTTVTFGQGITLTAPLTINTSTSAVASIAIDPLAYTGNRTVTVTTGTEVVSGNLFNVITGPAILSTISPSSANQGQHILMTINGEFTHWSQTLTQFSISGGGYDITVNGVVINSPTQAIADLSISGTAALGTRTVFMSTEGENVALSAGFLVTGGIPAIISVSPSSGTAGDVGDNIIITGIFTNWTAASTVDFGDLCVPITNYSVNSSTSITAVINIGAAGSACPAALGIHTVTVRTGAQALTSQFNVLPKIVPVPYISYEYPSVALVGQTLQVNFSGAYTEWETQMGATPTTVTFGAGITVNTFQVLGPASATANITINPMAGVGSRTVTFTTGAETESTTFLVTVGTPVISLVDPSSAIQGDTRDIDLVGQYTTWQQGVTNFTFCPGIIINSTNIFGPNAARVNITVPIAQPTGGCGVRETTNSEVAYNISPFSITPSTATITSVSPNTAMQGTQNFVVNVTGLATHWQSLGLTPNFSLGGGVSVASATVNSDTSATLTLDLAPLATPGFYSLTATTGGEVATLNNAFVVQPGTPILLSSIPGSFEQQAQFSIGILGQFTSFVSGTTNVTIPGSGANITTVNVTGPQSITVLGNVNPVAFTGCHNIVVTTGAQVLTLFSAFCVTNGPAAITQLSPNNGGTGATNLTVNITGTNTNWVQGTTVGTFGPGISLNSLTINSSTSATANITIAANANPEANTVTLTTAGEVASDPLSFTIFAATPVLDIVFPGSGAQGTGPISVNVTGSFTHFSQGNTTANFGGMDITTAVNVTDTTHATVSATISPIAALTTRTVQLTTNLGGGSQEVASKASAFTVTAGNATISSATPTTPATVHQNDSGDIFTIIGSNTHFTLAPLTNASVVFCSGISTAAVTVNSDTKLTVTVNVSTFAPVGPCGVTVTTGGEVAAGMNLFTVLAGIPIITQVNPNTAHQGDQNVTVNIAGLYTHFTSGALSVAIPGGTLVGSVTPNSDTSATAVFNFSTTAAAGPQTVTVSDTADGSLNDSGAFTIVAGVPALISAVPNTMGQGVTQNVTLTGQFTHFSSSSVVTISGTLVTAGAVLSTPAPTMTQIVVPITVQAGAAATNRTITVTTGGETVQLVNGFTVQAGVPNITQISPNIGVPNSVVPVTITGIFTSWVSGTTTVSFGPQITLSNLNISSTSITANLNIPSGATLGPVNVVVTTGAQILTAINGFTVQSTTTTAPVVTFTSPTNGASGVPINTQVSVTFSEPLNGATIPTNGANAFITDATTQGGCWAASGLPATVGLDVSGRVLTITPTNPLGVGRTFYLQLNSYSVPGGTPAIADQSGNALGHYCYSFVSGFTQDTSGPTFLTGNIPSGATNVPTNTQTVILGFNKPINPATQSAGLSITTSGNPVAGVWSYSTDFTKSIFTPNSALLANTTYLVTYTAAITGETGVALTNPGSFSFTTGAGADNTGGAYLTWTPPYGEITPTTGTNPTIRFTYNKPVNPLTVTPATFYVYNQVTGATVTGTSVTWSPDFKTFTLNLPGQLQPGTNYHWTLSGAQDWLGNGVQYGSVNFTTAAAADTTAPSVVTISPSSAISCGGNPCAPVNSEVQIQFSELMDPTSLTAGAVTLTPTSPPGAAVTGTFSFSPDNSCTTPNSSGNCNFSLLTFTPSTNLSANTTYQVSIPDGQLADLSGNFDPFTSSFTTGSSSTADTTHGSVSSITPGSGATNIPLNTNVVVQLNKVVDPLTVNTTSFRVYDSTAGLNVPGTITVSTNQQTLTFAQTLPFEPNHQICVYVSYFQSFYDLAGNYFNYASECFTAGAGTDTTAPTVISVSPLNNATGIGPNNPVMVTFSKSMNPGTFGNNVAIYNGSALFSQNYSYSSNGTTLIFSTGNLPYATNLTVVVSPNVTDLEGNHLASEFSSTFATVAQPVTAQPSVTAMRPGSGATGVPATNPVTFFMSAPMNSTTINSGTLIVSQNGTAMTGSISIAADNQDVTFTPTGGTFAAGALIQVFFTNGATDANGNALANFQSSFTVAPSVVGVNPAMLSAQPTRYSGGNDITSVVDVLFNKPLNPATVTGSNFFLSSSSSGTPLVAGTISLLDGGRLARFKPSSALSASTPYYVFLTTGIQDTTGLSFTGGSSSYLYYFYTGTTSNSAAPSISATAPTNGASGIGTNALVSLTFSENVDQLTLDPSNVTLASGATNIPVSLVYNSSTLTMTATPMAPLPPSASITLTLNGVTDNDGDAFNPTPYTLSFNTGPAPDYNPPVLLTSNIASNQSGVPVTTSISLTFNKPIDMRSVVLQNTLVFQDLTTGGNPAATVSPIGSSALLVTPSALLSVDHQYRLYYCSLADLNGNTTGCNFNVVFTTALTPPSGGPVVTQMIPVNGTNPPVNFSPMVQFDRPVSPVSLAGVTLMQGGSPVAATPQLSSGGTVLTLVPNSILTPGAAYTFTVTGVQDAAGNTMSGSASRSFTAGPAIELTSPVITLGSPINNSTTGTNPEILFTFSEQINPITSGSFNFYNTVSGGFVNGSTLNWAADFKSVRITYPGTLSPGTRYYFYLNSVCNLANNCVGAYNQYLYTGSSADSGPESVTSVNPPNGASGVPTNPAITLALSTPVAAASVNNSSVTLSPAVPGTTISVSSDGYTLTLNLAASLAASTPYTISVASGAFTDQNGVAVSSFSSTFTTGTSTETSSTHGSISMTIPAPGSTGVAINSAITVTFSQPLNPNSLNSSTFVVYENNNSSFQIAGTVTNPTPTTLVFTPAVALPPGQQINAYVGYYASITDYAGNSFNYLSGCCGGTTGNFTTASTTDNTPPQVISFAPGASATNVGPYAPVSLTFNKSLNVNTINSSNFVMYNGSSLMNVSPSYSSDRRTVTFNTTLPYNATIEIAVNTSVQDYAGNNMTQPYTATFTTLPQPLTSAPSVNQSRPGNGAALNSPITLFMSSPMQLSAAQAGMFVAQNGVLISGTVSLTADLHGIIWTPSASYQAGALIEVYLTSTATDTTGNPANSYKFSFTTLASPAGAPTEIGLSPCRYCSITYTNPVVDVQFSKALNPATVTSATVQITQGSGPGGAAIAGTLSLLNNNTVIHFAPAAPMPSTAYFYVSLSSGIQDTTGDAFAGDSYYIYVNASAPDNTPPTVLSVTPANNSTSIGDNAPVRIVFNKLMDTLSINSTNIAILNGGSQIPYTTTFGTINSGTQTVATLLPQSPLPDSTALKVKLLAKVTDLTGTGITGQTTTFTTMAGADFSAPVVIEQSMDSRDNANVPTNVTFTLVFNKPLDPSTVIGNTTGSNTSGFYVYNNANCGTACYPKVNVNVSPDGKTVTMVPQANLAASSSSNYFYAQGATDLNGNMMGGVEQTFTTATSANVTGPTIVATNPLSTNPNPVPTNTSIEVMFSAPVSAASLGSITLTGGANGPYKTVLNNSVYTDDTVVRIIPQSLLLPNTTYTVNVSGVTDIAGNSAATTTFSFTTGPNFLTAGINESLDTATITTGGGTVALPMNTTVPNALDSPTITIVLNHAVDYAALSHNTYITLRNSSYNVVPGVTLNYALSADQTTLTVTTSGLASGTTYRLLLDYFGTGYDIAGNPGSSDAVFTFTTQ